MIQTIKLPANANVKKIKRQLADLLLNADTEFLTLDYGDSMVIICHGGTNGSTTCEKDILRELGEVYKGQLAIVSCHPFYVQAALKAHGIKAQSIGAHEDETHVIWRSDNTIDLFPDSEHEAYKSSSLERSFDYAAWIQFVFYGKGK